MTRTVVYARFSPRRDEETSESNLTQLEQCRAYAVKSGWTVASEHEDAAACGDDETRPGLWAAVEALQKDDVLLVYRLDRLARNPYLAYCLEREAEKRGARIVSTQGEGTWGTTPEDELIRGILQHLASYTKKIGAARTKAAMQRHQRAGRRMSGTFRRKGGQVIALVPFGRMLDPQDPARMVDHPEELKTIALVREFARDGLGCCAIARMLGEAGRLCRGRKWHHETVKRILARGD